jgi:adenosylmethionine-8-amino-7-oxononanoate aminotransferase
MVWAFEVSTTDHQFPQTFRQMAWENGLLLRPLGHTVYFMPPYSITEEEILFLLDNTLNTIEQYFRQHPA